MTIITIITKITANNNQNSKKIFVLKTYQTYKNTNAQYTGNKTARHLYIYIDR